MPGSIESETNICKTMEGRHPHPSNQTVVGAPRYRHPKKIMKRYHRPQRCHHRAQRCHHRMRRRNSRHHLPQNKNKLHNKMSTSRKNLTTRSPQYRCPLRYSKSHPERSHLKWSHK
jgi:hypothetical protein